MQLKQYLLLQHQHGHYQEHRMSGQLRHTEGQLTLVVLGVRDLRHIRFVVCQFLLYFQPLIVLHEEADAFSVVRNRESNFLSSLCCHCHVVTNHVNFIGDYVWDA